MERSKLSKYWVLLVLFFAMQVVHGETLKEKQELYWNLDRLVNSSDFVLIPPLYPSDDPFKGLRIFTREQYQQYLFEAFPNTTFRQKNDLFILAVEQSDQVKSQIRERTLPQLANEIRSMLDAPAGDSADSGSGSFRDLMDNLTDDDRLAANSFQNIDEVVGNSSNGGTPIPDSGSSSFDRGWSDTAAEQYEDGCPKINTRSSTSWRLYPNGIESGYTYTKCNYYGDKRLASEIPFVNKKVDGTKVLYGINRKHNIHYVSERGTFTKGKRDGMTETYKVSKTGAVIRNWYRTYKDNVVNGTSVNFHDNGQEHIVETVVNGYTIRRIIYKPNGEMSSCNDRVSQKKWKRCN